MKHIFFLSWLCIIFFYSCTDPQVIGLEIQPETDKITISSLNDDSPFIASTQKVDSVRSSQTVYALLGKYESTSLLDAEASFSTHLRLSDNDNLQTQNQIGQKTSNFFSELMYSPNDFIIANYKNSLKNNLTDISYENLNLEFSINNFVTTFDYLNENDTKDKNSYLKSTARYKMNDTNSILFSTRRNKKTDLTEYYNLIYQYKNDCLAASIEYNKDYYNDDDIKPEESIYFKLTIIPIGETNSPNLMKK